MLAPHLPKSTKSRTSHDPRPSLEAEPSETPAVVLPSSTEMFYFFGQSLEQCVKLGIGAGTGKALFDLTTVWKKWLKVYAGADISALAPNHVDFESLMTRGCSVDCVETVRFYLCSNPAKPLFRRFTTDQKVHEGQRKRDGMRRR
jgi:hypothetical protein